MPALVFDSDVLIHLYKYIPKLKKYIKIFIPPAVERETRRNNTISELIKQDFIEVKDFSDLDRREVYNLIKRRIKKEVAGAYLHGKLRKNAGEYEACYLAKREKISVIVFDRGAWNFARTLLIDVYTLAEFPLKFIPKESKNLRIEILEKLCKQIRIKEACEELNELMDD